MCHAVLWEQAARSQRQRQRQGIGSSSDAGRSGIASTDSDASVRSGGGAPAFEGMPTAGAFASLRHT